MNICKTQEVWEDVQGYEGLYLISNLGRVKILPRIKINKGSCLVSKEKFSKIRTRCDGYYGLSLTLNNEIKHYYLHRLLAIHFIPNPENKPQVNHINGIKNDNRLENLEWATSKENIIHARDKGLRLAPKGDSHSSSKLTELQVLDIKERLKKRERNVFIANYYNVNSGTISAIKREKNWKHLKGQAPKQELINEIFE